MDACLATRSAKSSDSNICRSRSYLAQPWGKLTGSVLSFCKFLLISHFQATKRNRDKRLQWPQEQSWWRWNRICYWLRFQQWPEIISECCTELCTLKGPQFQLEPLQSVRSSTWQQNSNLVQEASHVHQGLPLNPSVFFSDDVKPSFETFRRLMVTWELRIKVNKHKKIFDPLLIVMFGCRFASNKQTWNFQ